MTDKTDKKIYWVEGVTKKEVMASLSDKKPSIFRNNGSRKLLVAFLSLSIIGLQLTFFVDQPKLKSYAEFILMAAILVSYLLLRKAVRLLADAPTELLDERQIKLRNNAYLYAYRLLTYIVLIYLFSYFLINRDTSNALFPRYEVAISTSIFSICAWITSLPSMVLVWSLPSEEND